MFLQQRKCVAVVVSQAYLYHDGHDVVIHDNHVQLETRNRFAKHTKTPLDGYRRAVGDVKALLARQQ